MRLPKRRLAIALIAAMAIAVLVPMTALAEEAETIDIVVAPSTINLNYQGPCITVHTNLHYTAELEANYGWYLEELVEDVEAYDVFADDCENLVAKFNSADVTSQLDPSESLTLTLEGRNRDGVVAYQGSDEVRVIKRGK